MLNLIPLPYRIAAIAIAALAIFAAGWVKGNDHGTQKLTDYLGEQAAATMRLIQAREKIVTVTETKWRTRIQTVYKQGETIERTVYVTKADDAGCTVPVGFVRQYNASWSGTAAGPAAESDRGASGVPLTEVASADTHNAIACRVYKEQRDGLIEFYRKLQAAK